jgi:NADH-quinone oxidoreductase subunit L
MLVPLAVLSIGAIAAGFVFKEAFIGHGYESFWKTALFTGKDNHIIHDFHKVPKWVVWSPFVAMVLGFAGAFYCYVLRPHVPGEIAKRHEFLYRFLLSKWYFDELYDWLFVRPAKWLGHFLWKKGDGMVIDGLGPDGISARVVDITSRVVRLQTGYVYHYAFSMIMGVGGLITWYLLTRG